MKVLITGGAGFLGSHLTDALLRLGYKVVVLDNLITGNLANLSANFGNPNFTFIKQDVTDYIYIAKPVDWVVHMASPASPVDYLRYPIQTLKVGALGTHKALGLAKSHRARFLLASTSEVYGDPLIHPQREEYWGNVNPIGPRGVYDEAKRFAEAITMAYHRVHGVDTRIIRIFNTYGPRMRASDGRVISNLIVQALTGQPLTIYGSGEQTRSFCYVDDLIEGIIRLIRYKLESDNEDIYIPINLGNPKEFTINDLALTIQSLTKTESEIEFCPLPVDDPKIRKPCIERAQRCLGWTPKVSLPEGLKLTISHFREILLKEESYDGNA